MDLSGKAVLLVIDVQVGFEDPVWGVRNNPSAEMHIGRLLSFWRHSKRPVFHVRHDSTSPTSPLRPRQRGNAFKPQVAPLGMEKVFAKTVNSAFIGTGLEAALRAGNHKTLVIVGLTTNHCVSTTARMAGNLGFKTYVVSDATACFARKGMDGRMRLAADVHAAALSDLQGEFATVLETGAFLEAVSTE
jgi:nicotinamidase-related amidase